MKGATRCQRLHDIVFSAGAGAIDAIHIDETRSQRIGEAGRRKPDAVGTAAPHTAGSDDDPVLVLRVKDERCIEVAVVRKIDCSKIWIDVYNKRVIGGLAVNRRTVPAALYGHIGIFDK